MIRIGKKEKSMNEDIKSLISDVLKDINEIRESELTLKERIPLEIMALNAVANAYDKIGVARS